MVNQLFLHPPLLLSVLSPQLTPLLLHLFPHDRCQVGDAVNCGRVHAAGQNNGPGPVAQNIANRLSAQVLNHW